MAMDNGLFEEEEARLLKHLEDRERMLQEKKDRQWERAFLSSQSRRVRG